MRDKAVDIHAPEFARDPYPTYAELREQCPIIHSDQYADDFGGFWMLTRYDDVKSATVDWRTYTSSVPGVTAIPIITRRTEPALPLEMDPPLHSRYRALVAPVFSAQRVEALRARIEAIANRLLEPIVAAGGGDLVSQFAVQLSVQSLAEFTGLPKADIGRWLGWIRRMFNVADREDGARASREFSDYINALISERRAAPQDDLISLLMAQEVEGHRLTNAELNSFTAVVFGAGFETTADGLSVMLDWLARHPQERAELFARPELIAPAVEEFLRFSTPIQIFGRNASHAVEVHGRQIEAGAVVALSFASANHDPQVFAEPEACRLDRSPNPHLAFGAGIHLCLGAPIARMEMAVTLAACARQMPSFRPASDAEPAWKLRGDRRGLSTLPVVI
jgi:cytochrome P450